MNNQEYTSTTQGRAYAQAPETSAETFNRPATGDNSTTTTQDPLNSGSPDTSSAQTNVLSELSFRAWCELNGRVYAPHNPRLVDWCEFNDHAYVTTEPEKADVMSPSFRTAAQRAPGLCEVHTNIFFHTGFIADCQIVYKYTDTNQWVCWWVISHRPTGEPPLQIEYIPASKLHKFKYSEFGCGPVEIYLSEALKVYSDEPDHNVMWHRDLGAPPPGPADETFQIVTDTFSTYCDEIRRIEQLVTKLPKTTYNQPANAVTLHGEDDPEPQLARIADTNLLILPPRRSNRKIKLSLHDLSVAYIRTCPWLTEADAHRLLYCSNHTKRLSEPERYKQLCIDAQLIALEREGILVPNPSVYNVEVHSNNTYFSLPEDYEFPPEGTNICYDTFVRLGYIQPINLVVSAMIFWWAVCTVARFNPDVMYSVLFIIVTFWILLPYTWVVIGTLYPLGVHAATCHHLAALQDRVVVHSNNTHVMQPTPSGEPPLPWYMHISASFFKFVCFAFAWLFAAQCGLAISALYTGDWSVIHAIYNPFAEYIDKWATGIRQRYADAAVAAQAVAEGVGQAVNAAQVLNQLRADTERYYRIFTTLKFNEINSDDKVFFLEIKSALHLLYHLYSGDSAGVASRATDFIVTRPTIAASLMGCQCEEVARAVREPIALAHVNGNEVALDALRYRALVEHYDRHNTLDGINPHGLVVAHGKSLLVSTLSSVITAFGNDVKGLSREDLQLLNNQFTYTHNFERKIESTLDLAQQVISVLGRTLFGVDPFDPDFQQYVGKMIETIMFTENAKLRRLELPNDRALMAAIRVMHAEASIVYANPRMMTINSSLAQAFSRAYKELGELTLQAKCTLDGVDGRNEPFSILLTGPPNVGKTTFMRFAMKGICKLMGTTFDGSKAFFLNTEANFPWARYAKQMFVVRDDLWKVQDKNGRAVECCNIIDMVNTALMVLDMPGIEEKGNVHFDSQFVFFTTNMMNEGYECAELANILGMTDPSAVMRRFHLILHKERVVDPDIPIHEDVFRVDKCSIDRHVGRWYSGKEIVEIIHECRQAQLRQAGALEYNDADIDRIFEAPQHHGPVPMAPPRPNEGEVEVHAFKWRVWSTHELYAAMCDLGVYQWLKSDHAKYMAMLFAVIAAVAVAKPLYETFFGVSTHSPPNTIKVGRTTRARGSYNRGDTIVKRNFKTANHKKVKHKHEQASHNADQYKLAARHINSQTTNKPAVKSNRQHGGISVWNGKFSGHHNPVTTHSNEDNFIESADRMMKSVLYIGARGYTDATRTELVCHSTAVATHIKDRVLMTVAHFIRYFDECPVVDVYIDYGGERYVMELPPDSELLEDEFEDIVFFRIPTSIPMPPSTYDRLFDYEVDNFVLTPGFPLRMLSRTTKGAPSVRSMTFSMYAQTLQYTASSVEYTVDTPIGYYAQAEKGDSGALILAPGDQGRPTIIGMHFGAQTSLFSRPLGVAIQIHKSDVDIVLQFFNGDFDVEEPKRDVCQTVTHNSGDDPDPGFVPYQIPLPVLTTVSPEMAHVPSGRTKIRRSSMYCWDRDACPDKLPARLKPFKDGDQIIDPVYKALLKVTTEHYPPCHIPESTFDYLKYLYPRPDYPVGILGPLEALNGSPESGVGPISMSTSAGWPYTKLKPGMKGKSGFIRRTDNGLDYEPMLREEVDDVMTKLFEGKDIGDVYWADNLKDETRPVAKVRDGKSRLISACSLKVLIPIRALFGDFVGYVQSKAATHPVSVGINPHGMDWTILANRLDRFHESVIAGDFTNYDSKVPKFLILLFVAFVNWWYNDGEEAARARYTIMECITEAKHLIYDKVYVAIGGQPSGNPITSILNSFVNLIMTHHVLVNCLHIPEDKWAAAFYGDDQRINLGVPGIRWIHLAPHYKRCFGMDYTNGAKTLDDVDVTSSDVTYLGRRFVRSGSIVRAPLDKRIIYESLYWNKGGEVEGVTLSSTISNFFLEMSHFTKDEYDEASRELIAAIRQRVPHLEQYALTRNRSWWFFQRAKYFGEGSVDDYVPAYLKRSEFAPYGVEVHSSDADPMRVNVVDTRNTQFTERASNDPAPTQEGQLGDIHDVGPVSASSVNSVIIQNPQTSFTAESFNLNGVINRTYEIANLAWLQSQAMNTVLATYQFPKVLISDEAFIRNKVDDFVGFKAGIRFAVRPVAQKFAYGTVMVEFVPDPPNDQFPSDSVYRASGSPHMLVSASSSEAKVMDVPFVCPHRYINLRNFAPDIMGHFQIRVLNPLTSTSDTISNVSLIITAQFIDAELVVPHATSVLTEGLYSFSRQRGLRNVETHSNNVHVKDIPRSSEAKLKAEHGSVSDTFVRTTTQKPLMRAGQWVRQCANTFVDTMATAAVGAVLGLSKPNTLEFGQVVMSNPFMNLAYGKGINVAPKIAVDPENAISTVPDVAGINVDEMEMLKIVGTPQLVRVVALDSTSTTPVRLATMGPGDGEITFVDAVTRMFNFWSGSYKVKLYIAASLFHAVRIVIWISDGTINADEWESCYYKIIDIQGDTEVEMTMPYLEKEIVKRTDDPTTFSLQARVLSWSVPDSTLVNPIYLNVYKAGASDFRVYGPRDVRIDPHHNPRADFVKEFPPFQASFGSYNQSGYVVGEVTQSVRDIIHRPMGYGPVTQAAGAPIYAWDPPVAPSSYYGLEMWGLFYRFWRGSITITMPQRNNTITNFQEVLLLGSGPQLFTGSTMASANNPVLEATVPYYEGDLYQSCAFGGTLHVVCSNRSQKYLMKSAGDDFSFHWLRGVPAFPQISETGFGQRGMIDWSQQPF